MAWKYNNSIIRAGKAWKDKNGITHPSTWMRWSDDEKKAAGLVWENDPAPFDSRFYKSAGVARALDDVKVVDEDGKPVLDGNGNQVVLLGLKTQYKAQTKAIASGLISPTDWYIIRKQEDNTKTIPSAITTYRAAVRTASGKIEAAIDGAANLDAFIALFDTPVDDNDNPTGNAPIDDWPDEV